MGLRQRFKPCGKALGHDLIAGFQRLNPRKLALQRRGDIDRRPADHPQALIKPFRRHDDWSFLVVFAKLTHTDTRVNPFLQPLIACASSWVAFISRA